MGRPRGRPNDTQHRRRRLILGALANRGTRGVSRVRLELELIRELGQDPRNAEAYVKRDLRELRNSGWDIRSEKRPDGHFYVLRVVDPRLHKYFTNEERAQLLRAAQSANLGQLYEDLGQTKGDPHTVELDETLGDLEHAITVRCLVRFSYKQKHRVVDPYHLLIKEKGWLLRGMELSSGLTKSFYLHDIQDLEIDRAGTAGPRNDDDDASLDPLRWDVHDPVDVTLSASLDFFDEVVTHLGGTSDGSREDQGIHVLFTVPVTNTDAFLSRLFELGERVRLVGPPEMRAAAREWLKRVAGDVT